MRRVGILASPAAILVLALNTYAAQVTTDTAHDASTEASTTAAPQPSPDEGRILVDMRQMNQSFIQSGRLARKKGFQRDVRRLGDRMVRDHTLSQSLITEFARNHNIVLPEKTPAGKKADAETEPTETAATNSFNTDELKSASGAQFDGAIISAVRTQYAHAIESLTKAHDQLPSNSALRNWLSRMLPILRQNEAIAARLGPPVDKEKAR
jgi:predicted outer membrane protein